MTIAPNHQSLNPRIENAAAGSGGMRVVRVRRTVAHTIVAQMLPRGVVKGGTALRMRVSEADATDDDLDFAPPCSMTTDDVVDRFETGDSATLG